MKNCLMVILIIVLIFNLKFFLKIFLFYNYFCYLKKNIVLLIKCNEYSKVKFSVKKEKNYLSFLI